MAYMNIHTKSKLIVKEKVFMSKETLGMLS